ncbi:MAG: 4-hydroxythreonine-4-phosphate dehydrogenase PdxA [Ignavibacteriaceae bacterium]|nr:4-hydroxythreonine-4-phosphate dehydrogenase PdxA [Ignavibacteriaceae bacterium]HRN26575.1 4-hydroxythreonine-4-phosphate dehydrogenase PdxA [Ignavibacteriaceae bacterium]HRQ54150.1 4-hydroxythreonine-4-phosphate dehydrogenase PdxA [Ignavibacteriaceae bacterium]
MTRVVFTCGDINGIGPEIALKAFKNIFSKKHTNKILFVCPENVFEHYYKLTKASFEYRFVENNNYSNSSLNLIRLPGAKLKFGFPTKISGQIAFDSIKKSIELINHNLADALVTAPISKEAFSLAKNSFPGHTELLAASEKNNNYMMLFLSDKIKAGLLTIHIPISKVSELITKEKLVSAVELLNKTAKQDLKILNPKIAVLGLNPHAGENGLIGNEEIRIINPVIKSLQKKINVSGPYVPDAFWGNKSYKNFDLILGMYHDQVLIPFKLLNFDNGVNFTAGLKLIRTSPDHGTAYDIAGLNKADESSIMQSYKYAINIFNNRKSFIAASK